MQSLLTYILWIPLIRICSSAIQSNGELPLTGEPCCGRYCQYPNPYCVRDAPCPPGLCCPVPNTHFCPGSCKGCCPQGQSCCVNKQRVANCCKSEEQCCDGTCCGESEYCCTTSPECCPWERKMCGNGDGFGCSEQSPFMPMGPYDPAITIEPFYASQWSHLNPHNNTPLGAPRTIYRSLNSREIEEDPCGADGSGFSPRRWNEENRERRVAVHVSHGSKKGYRGDWFVSFTTNIRTAWEKYKGRQGKMAVVKVSDIDARCDKYDFNLESVRDEWLRTEDGRPFVMAQRFARADSEYVVRCDWNQIEGIPCSYYQREGTNAEHDVPTVDGETESDSTVHSHSAFTFLSTAAEAISIAAIFAFVWFDYRTRRRV